MTIETSTIKSQGRPRSQKCHRAIMEATIELLEDRSVRELSIEAIAKKAGVGKTTIYRWWPCKTAVVFDAFLEYMLPRTEYPERLSAIEALSEQVKMVIEAFSGKIGRIVAEILAEGQSDPERLAEYRERFLNDRRAAAAKVIEKGKKNGEFSTDLDTELAIDIMYGPIYYRLLVGHLPLDRNFSENLPKQVIKGLQNCIKSDN